MSDIFADISRCFGNGAGTIDMETATHSTMAWIMTITLFAF
jgi:hypothetical protein